MAILQDDRHVLASPSFLQLFGYTQADIEAGLGAFALIPEEERPRVIRLYEARMASKPAPDVVPMDLVAKDGTRIPCEATGHTIEHDGRPGMLVIVRDLRQRKRNEEALRRSEAQYRAVVETQTELIHRWRLDGFVTTFANDAVCRHYGIERESLVGTCWLRLIPEDARRRLRELLQTLSPENPVVTSEHAATAADGSVFWEEWVNRGLFDETGTMVEVQSTGRDVTALKQAEKSLRESEEAWRTLAEESPNMIFINVRGRIVYANRRCEEVMGYNREEFYAPDFQFLSLIAPEFTRLTRENFQRHMRGEEVAPYLYAVVTKEGRRIDTIITTRLIPYRGERAILGIVTDVTQLKCIQRELEMANRHKDEFLANVSHDLRTPLTSILGAADMLRSGRGAGREAKYVEMVLRNGNHLVKLVNDIVDLSRIESGRVQLSPALHAVASLVAEAHSFIEMPAREAGVTVVVEPGEDAHVWADRTRVLQILDNLLTNAVKFTPTEGQVTLGWTKRDGTCEVRVADTGIGIPAEEQHRVFSRFDHIAKGPVHTHMRQGIGIGLSVVRTLVEMQGGQASFESREGAGSTFRFTLPTAPQAPSAGEVEDRADSAPPIHGARILMVEDNAEIAEMIRVFLASEGAAVRQAATGREAARAARGWRPELILLDMRLPDTDGYCLAATLKCDPATWDIPIIALTAQAMAHDRQRCIDSGCVDYVSKPVNFDRLQASIARALGRTARGGPDSGGTDA
jgi:PAS domain S-box-containing protein